MGIPDKLLQFGAAYLLKEVGTGTESSFWQKVSKSKAAGLLLVLYGAFGYGLGQLTFEQASGLVTAGFGMIFLRQGQASEADRVTAAIHEHLSDQDRQLTTLDDLLDRLNKMEKK